MLCVYCGEEVEPFDADFVLYENDEMAHGECHRHEARVQAMDDFPDLFPDESSFRGSEPNDYDLDEAARERINHDEGDYQ